MVTQTVDMHMQSLRVQPGPRAETVLLQDIQGRLQHQAWLEGLGQDVRSQDMTLTLEDGEHWELGNSRVAWRDEGEQMADAGELQLQGFSLEMLSRIAQRLPLDPVWRSRLTTAQAKGLVFGAQ
jgi:hypothetical protein